MERECTQNTFATSYIKICKKLTDEICMKVVKNYGYMLDYVVKQTDEICMAAVKQYGRALYYVKNKTPEICAEAIKQDPTAKIYANYN